jgi:hypothetical protein
MYDTLMQMGRWFGYREGYADLMRLYTPEELQAWYRDITIANEELGAKFDEMARVGSNPRDFALYVRKSPAGLLVTAQAKMRSGREMDLSFADDVIETIAFERDAEVQRANFGHVETFLARQSAAGRHTTIGQHPGWRGLPGEAVASLLEIFRTHKGASKARGRLMAEYVRSRLEHGELVDWTVVLIHNSSIPEHERLGFAGEKVGLTYRKYFPGRGRQVSDDPGDGDYRIRRLGDPEHEALDLEPEERALADLDQRMTTDRLLRDAKASGVDSRKVKRPSIGPFARKRRPRTRGLLCIYLLEPGPAKIPSTPNAIPGLLVSFPASPGAPSIKYVVPRRYWEKEAA